MKRIFIIALLALQIVSVKSQTFFGYGTRTGPFNPVYSGADTGSISLFYPSPPQGDFFYGLSTSSGAKLTAANPGIPALGSGTEVVASAASGSLASNYCKFGVTGYTTANTKEAYTRFEVIFADSTGYGTTPDGVWYYCLGDGQSPSDFLNANNTASFDVLYMACVIRWTFGASGTLQTDYWDYTLNGGSGGWASLTSSLTQTTKYVFEIFLNANTSTPPSYTKNGTSYSVSKSTMDIWIDNVRFAAVANVSTIFNTTYLKKIESWGFFGNESNSAFIFTDHLTYGGTEISLSTDYYSTTSGSLHLTSNWGTSIDGTGTNPSNFTTQLNNFYIRNSATKTINGLWSVTGLGSRVILGDGTNACDFTIPTDIAFTGNIDVSNNGTLTMQNDTIPAFSVLATGSTVYYDLTGAQDINYSPFYNLKTGSTGTKTLTTPVSATGTITAGDASNAGTLYIPADYSLTGSVNVNNNGTLDIGNSTSPTLGTLATGSTVKYSCAIGAQTTPASDPTFHHLTIDNTNGVSLGATNTVNGTLLLTDGALSIGAYTLILGGDLTISSGSLTGGASSNITVNSSGNKISLPTVTNGLNTLTVSRTNGVDIAGDNTTISTSISTAGVLNILEGKTLTVSGTLTNSNGTNTSYLNIKSSATGTGNLICSTTGIYGTVECYLLGHTTNNPYHYISSSINGGSFSDIWTSGDYNVYWYDETVVNIDLDIGWTRISSGTLTNGRGYALVSNYASRTLDISGVLNASTVSPTVSFTATGGYTVDPQGYNLIGNPFPTTLSVQEFFKDNATDLDPQAIYYWDDSDGSITRTADYSTRTASVFVTGSGSASGDPGSAIPVGQGFFVKVKSGVSSLAFESDQKMVFDSLQFFTPSLQMNLWLSVEGPDELYNEIAITFAPDATKEFDPYYDANKLRGNPNIALYSFVDGSDDQYVIQGRPYYHDNDIIRLGLHAGIAGEYSFKIKNLENFSDFTKIYLVDKLTGKTINLSDDNHYKLYLNEGEYNDRFFLQFTNSDIVSIEEVPNDIEVYSYKSSIYIAEVYSGKVIVYDPLGKVLLEDFISHNESKILSIPNYKGFVLVSINNGQHIKKLFLN